MRFIFKKLDIPTIVKETEDRCEASHQNSPAYQSVVLNAD